MLDSIGKIKQSRRLKEILSLKKTLTSFFLYFMSRVFFSFYVYIGIERIVKEELIMVIVRGKNVTITDAIGIKLLKTSI